MPQKESALRGGVWYSGFWLSMKRSEHNHPEAPSAAGAHVFEAMRGVGFSHRSASRRGAIFFQGFIFALLLAVASLTLEAQTPKPVQPEGYGSSSNPYKIKAAENLLWMSQNAAFLGGQYFSVTEDIDASATESWESGKGFPPIGSEGGKFGGYVFGNGKKIIGLKINRPGSAHVGLFGYADGAIFDNLRLESPEITGGGWTGGLVGYLNNGQVNGCSVGGSASIRGGDYVGALTGAAYKGVFTWCYAVAQVNGQNYVGGLIGMNSGDAQLSGCYTMGSVTGSALYVGGLSGWSAGAVSACYSTAVVRGHDRVGGLIGQNSKVVNASYAVGYVVGVDKYKGGLVGYGTITLSDSYWDRQTSGQQSSAGSQSSFGLTTAQMKSRSSYWGWNFSNFWDMHPQINSGYPFMRSLVPYQTSTIPPAWEYTLSNGRLRMTWAVAPDVWLERSERLESGWERVPESELKESEGYYTLSVSYIQQPIKRQYYRLAREVLVQPVDGEAKGSEQEP